MYLYILRYSVPFLSDSRLSIYLCRDLRRTLCPVIHIRVYPMGHLPGYLPIPNG